MASFEEAVVRAKVAKICDYVGYHAITKDSSGILVDLYIKTFVHLARHCKDFANYNQRVEPTLIDLLQAFDFIGVSAQELKEHADSVKIPLDIKIEREDARPSNRIQRDRFVDEQLELEKNNDEPDDNDDGRTNVNLDADEEDKNMTPLLKDIYKEISNQFPSPSKPVKADKVRIKREEKPVIPKLKITPLDPSIAEPPSFLPILENIKQENLDSSGISLTSRIPPLSERPGRGRRKGVKNKGPKTNLTTKAAKLKTKIKTKGTKGQKRGRKPNALRQAAKALASPEPREPSPEPSIPTPVPRQPSPSPPPQPIASTSAITKTTIKLEIPTSHTQSPIEDDVPLEAPPTKHIKKEKKKKKRSSNQFAIVTETVTAESEEKEWICPTCRGPDNGGLMVGCDTCDLWYHLLCTDLKREPKEEERWSCIRCVTKKEPTPAPPVVASGTSQNNSGKECKKGRKKSRTLVDVPAKATKTPEPQLAQPTTPLPMIAENDTKIRPSVICTSQDDLCPECQLPDDGTLMIQCDGPECGRWFHGKCVNVLEEPGTNDSWFCNGCVEAQASAYKRRRRI